MNPLMVYLYRQRVINPQVKVVPFWLINLAWGWRCVAVTLSVCKKALPYCFHPHLSRWELLFGQIHTFCRNWGCTNTPPSPVAIHILWLFMALDLCNFLWFYTAIISNRRTIFSLRADSTAVAPPLLWPVGAHPHMLAGTLGWTVKTAFVKHYIPH